MPRFLLKDSSIERSIEVIWEILAGALLVLAILKVVYKWQDLENEHTIMMLRNEDIRNDADQLLANGELDWATLNQFLKRASDIGMRDEDLFLQLSQRERQEAYREALKRLTPGVIERCARCNADPWNHQNGSCDMCGGIPVSL